MNKQMTAYSRVLPGILVYIQIPEYTDQNAIADDSECICLNCKTDYRSIRQENFVMRCIGIIGAMSDEVAGLKALMQDTQIIRKASMEFTQESWKEKK